MVSRKKEEQIIKAFSLQTQMISQSVKQEKRKKMN